MTSSITRRVTATDWAERASCRTSDPEELFVSGAAQHQAKRICASCPVQMECLTEALDHGMEFGIWGGLTERERRSLLRRHPEVTSWRPILDKTMARP